MPPLIICKIFNGNYGPPPILLISILLNTGHLLIFTIHLRVVRENEKVKKILCTYSNDILLKWNYPVYYVFYFCNQYNWIVLCKHIVVKEYVSWILCAFSGGQGEKEKGTDGLGWRVHGKNSILKLNFEPWIASQVFCIHKHPNSHRVKILGHLENNPKNDMQL